MSWHCTGEKNIMMPGALWHAPGEGGILSDLLKEKLKLLIHFVQFIFEEKERTSSTRSKLVSS